jgi:hypothetical protein
MWCGVIARGLIGAFTDRVSLTAYSQGCITVHDVISL